MQETERPMDISHTKYLHGGRRKTWKHDSNDDNLTLTDPRDAFETVVRYYSETYTIIWNYFGVWARTSSHLNSRPICATIKCNVFFKSNFIALTKRDS